MPRKQSRSVSHDTDYTRKTAKDYVYRAEWGTRGSKTSKDCVSIALAKHPLMVWARGIKELMKLTGHTAEERAACLELLREIDSLGEFKTGDKTFDLPVPSDTMHFQARITRIG